MCDECEAVWLEPAAVGRDLPSGARGPAFVVPELGVSIGGPAAMWANREQIEARGWASYIDPTSVEET